MDVSSLASWVPAPLLAGLTWLLLRRIAVDAEKRLSNLEDAVKHVNETMIQVKMQLPLYATLQQLGAMGDRLDGRITNLAQDIAVIKAGKRR